MDPQFEWDRLLVAVALLSIMFIIPMIIIIRDHRADRRRFGEAATSAPIRYTVDGHRYREGYPPPEPVRTQA
ncbi:hypothetical protein Ga0074812_10145 [Parafrankia irregularis]|uniref:Uncharacterized protein n=1 Tax=Parafrankia irregularis TaxID=795642 RepID=A0A0S4QDC2_9ACTN|nr:MULTISPECIES: hypothetical protein [Parafrankia]MBE3199780.1 hypothetical protein [Parafrankia sp. CH37]CUU53547.1 hypothetical protein Ga0074812_10145 [Parafrankia irregularis]